MPRRIIYELVTKPYRPESPADASLALTALGRLVSSGFLPASTRATDPLPQVVQERWAATRPGTPVPANVGDLLLRCQGDVDGNSLLDLDVSTLVELGLTQQLAPDAPLRELTRSGARFGWYSSFELEEFAGTHPELRPQAAEAALNRQDVYATVLVSQETSGVTVEFGHAERGTHRLRVREMMALTADGVLLRGSGDSSSTVFESASLVWSSDGKVVLELERSDGTKEWLDVAPSGRLRHSATGKSTEPAQLTWLYDGLLSVADARVAFDPTGVGPHLKDLLAVLERSAALRDTTTAPSDPAERVVWAGARPTPDELERRVTTLTQTWGVRPLRWHRWVDDPSEVDTARAILDATEGQSAIRPSYLYTVAIGEGLLFYLDASNRFTRVDTTMPVDGFNHLGVDTFGTQADALKRKGLLPADFLEGRDYHLTEAVNERNERVVTANFPDLPRGLVALRAMLASCHATFLADALRVLGPAAASRLTQDQVDYFTYVYFNAGPGFGKRHLQSAGLAAVRPWGGPPPPDNRIARFNALQRLSTLKLMESMDLFPAASPAPAPR